MDEVRTERLVGRRPLLRDAEELEPMLPEWDWAGGVHARLIREMDHWRRHRFGRWVWRVDGRIVGMVGLLAVDEGVELAWFLDPACWGRGYATEAARSSAAFAFDELGVDSITARTEPANARSRAVMERLGMVCEAEIEHAGLPHLLFRLTKSAS